MKCLAIDWETSIGTTSHGASFRDPTNDIYTQIWATHPEYVSVVHSNKGFSRTLYDKLAEELFYADVLVGHNLSFDLCYVWNTKDVKNYLLRGGKVWCTQYAEYILTGQQHTTASLAELQLKYLGEVEKPSRITSLFKRGIGADRIVQASNRCPRLWALYNEYCKTDGSTPLKIFKAQYSKAKATGMLAIVELYNDYLLSLINMTCTGVKVDLVKTEQTIREYTLTHLEYLEQAQNIIKEVWTDPRLPPFNINSVDHKSAALFGGKIAINENLEVGTYKNGKPKFKKTPTFVSVEGFGINPCVSIPSKKEGVYSTDGAVMAAIEKSTKNIKIKQYCSLQKKARMYEKASKTYLQAFIDKSVDGMLYPNYNNTITPTGRITSSEPNLQNLPAKSETAADVEGCLVAPEGWVCVSADFSQLEKWTQCLVSGDRVLQAKLESGACLHCVTLAAMEGLDYEWVYNKAKIEQDPVWDAKRSKIKPVGFLMDYGGMPQRVAEETGIPLEDVEEIYRVDKETYPDKHRFFEETLPNIVDGSKVISREVDIARSKKKGKDGSRFINGIELLPIFDNDGNVSYTDTDVRQVGYWQTNYGKKYHFTDNGRLSKFGLKRGFSKPKFKNYPNQGGGADIQAATTAELLRACLTKQDKIKMLMEIHDSKRFYVREDVLESVLMWIKKTVEDVPAIFMRRFGVVIPFKFPIEFEVGDDFGNMKAYKLGESNAKSN